MTDRQVTRPLVTKRDGKWGFVACRRVFIRKGTWAEALIAANTCSSHMNWERKP